MSSLDARLVLAAAKGDLETVKELVELGLDINYPNSVFSSSFSKLE